MARPLYAVCRIVKVFGIRGEVVAERIVDAADERLEALRDVFIGPTEAQAVGRVILDVRTGRKGIRVRIKGVETRNDAESLVGSFLFVDEDHREDPGPGRYHVETLVGMRVVDQEGRYIGTVREVMKMPAQDLYVVEKDEKEILIPAVLEFILDIDTAGRVMTVKLIEGLRPDDTV